MLYSNSSLNVWNESSSLLLILLLIHILILLFAPEAVNVGPLPSMLYKYASSQTVKSSPLVVLLVAVVPLIVFKPVTLVVNVLAPSTCTPLSL